MAFVSCPKVEKVLARIPDGIVRVKRDWRPGKFVSREEEPFYESIIGVLHLYSAQPLAMHIKVLTLISATVGLTQCLSQKDS